MGQHVDQVLMRETSPQSSSFVSGVSNADLTVQLDKVNKQLSKLSAALLSSTSGSSTEGEGRNGGRGSNGRGSGRGGGGRGKRKKYCWNCGGDHHIIQCTRTILKEKEKGGYKETVDDESAFFSEVHFDGLHVSKFSSSPEDVYFPCGDFESYNNNDEIMHHAAFSYTVPDVCDNDYSFLRIGRCDSFGESCDPVCLMAQAFTDSRIDTCDQDSGGELLLSLNTVECYDNVDQISHDFLQPTPCVCLDDSESTHDSANVSFVDDNGMDRSHSTTLVEPTALVAQVSYDS
jgi:hypothetical protein